MITETIFEHLKDIRNSKVGPYITPAIEIDPTSTVSKVMSEISKNDVDIIKENLNNQLGLVEKKNQDLEVIHREQVAKLEHVAGLSATGVYSSAYKIMEMAFVPLISFFQVIFPLYFKEGERGKKSI